MKKAITLRDIASRLGVNVSTVSRALNPETRSMLASEQVARVVAVAEALGYYPNRLAYALKKRKSFTVGAIIPDLNNPVFPPMMRGIQDELDAQGYTLVAANSDHDLAYEKRAVNKMRESLVDGLILATARLGDVQVDQCLQNGLPLVLINRTTNQPGVNAVVNDDAAGISLAVEHLVGLGHRRIAHIGGVLDTSTGVERCKAFLESVGSCGAEFDDRLLVFVDQVTPEAGKKAFAMLLGRNTGFTAVVAMSDQVAIGCLDMMKEEGLRCPEDVSITGFNDIPLVDRIDPPLTTLSIQSRRMGSEAAKLLIHVMGNKEHSGEVIKLQPSLVIRSSTGVPSIGSSSEAVKQAVVNQSRIR
ncbi:MAG: LacI family DNA-binding transcriptional regulator [Halopseudomonas sp.]